MTPRFFLPLVSLFIWASAAFGSQPTDGRRVVVIVWDGMRPDFISADTTPNLWQMAGHGVFFANHHPVFCSATEVNGTAIATGAYPAHSTVIANKEYRPTINLQKPINIEKPDIIQHGDEVSGGHYLGVPTLAEQLHSKGLRTAIAGSKQVALLHDRNMPLNSNEGSSILYEGVARPSATADALAIALPPFPAAGKDKTARDNWTTQALLKVLWKNEVPPYSLLWLAEPDNSQHATGPGSAQSLASIRNSDANLGLVLAELQSRGLRESTDVLVVSDHGFSTIERAIDVSSELTRAGFHSQRSLAGAAKQGDVLVAGNGGSVLLYVTGHDEVLCQRLCDYLQKQDWTGVIFSRHPFEGTFPLEEAHINSPDAPDLLVSLRWNHGRSSTGTQGLFVADELERGPGQGTHASLSHYDMHNTLVAAGPDFKTGISDPLPTGNTDLAPTILWLLGYKNEALKMDGRVLGEALAVNAPAIAAFEVKHFTARRSSENGTWEQYLNRSEVNGVHYFDEGNGTLQRK